MTTTEREETLKDIIGSLAEAYIIKAIKSREDKARNQAIDECLERIQKYFDKGDMDTPKLLTDMIESLKTKP